HRGKGTNSYGLRPDQVETQLAFLHVVSPGLHVDGDLCGVNKIPVGDLTGEETSGEHHQSAPAQESVPGHRVPFYCDVVTRANRVPWQAGEAPQQDTP